MAHVFISYSHADESFRKALRPQLAPLERRDLITVWDDRAIDAGMEWLPEIMDNLERADIVVLLLSADFVASNFCYCEEMTRALERQQRGESEVVPVIVRSFLFKGLPFTRLQCLPREMEPVAEWAHADRAWTAVAAAVETAIGRLRPRAVQPVHNLPPRNPHFTGREGLLAEMRRSLDAGREVALSALHGLGGIGKSQTALEYAWRHLGDYRVTWWLRAEREETLLSDLAALAVRLGVADADPRDLAGAARAALAALEGQPGWLLVYDNVETEEKVAPWLPRAGGHALLTSRDAVWQRVRSLPVDLLPPEEAAALLVERTNERDAKAAEALAEALGRLPLALEQAAAYMVENAWGCARYLDVFDRRRAELLKRGKPLDYPDTVATTWALAFEAVEKADPAAAQMLNLCAFLAPEAIPLDLLRPGAKVLPSPLNEALADELALGDSVRALRRYSLVTAEDATIALHRLVQEVVRDRLGEDGRKEWAERAVWTLLGAFPFEEMDIATWEPSRRLLPHAEAAAAHAQAQDVAGRATSTLLNNAGVCLYPHGLYERAEAVERAALALTERHWPADDPEVAICASSLATTLWARNKFDEARQLLARALAIDEAASGPDHPDVANSLGNLGGVLNELGDPEGAKARLERALRIDEAYYGPHHPKVATRASNLGRALYDLGDRAGARALYERALAIDTAKLPGHPNLAIRAHNLAYVLAEDGELERARDLWNQAVAIALAALGPDHPNTRLYQAALREIEARIARKGRK